jgi:peptidoglycan hydrolase-like protein with peptidoglycan-binding domain
MALTYVQSIASLEALNVALSQYRKASDEPFRRFAQIFLEKLELLAQLEPYFVEEINRATDALNSCQIARCYDPPENKRSCLYLEFALESAKKKYSSYKDNMKQLGKALADYKRAANSYESNLQNISSSIVPNFAELIGDVCAYSNNGNAAFGGGVVAGSPIGYTGGGAGVPSSATLGETTIAGATSGGAEAKNESNTPLGQTETAANNAAQNNNANTAVETNSSGENKPAVSAATAGAAGVVLASLIAGAIVLEKGGKNNTEHVIFLQEQLKGLGYKGKNGKKLVADGDYGENTKIALEQFQKDTSIKKDGVAGENTWKELQNINTDTIGEIGKNGFIDGGIIKKRIEKLENHDLKNVAGIVMHRTDSTNSKEVFSSFEKGIGTHFLVDKDGKIYQTASLNKTTQHVGKIKSKCYELSKCEDSDKEIIEKFGWAPKEISVHEKKKSYPNRYPTNSDSIGIEVVGKYNKQAKKWENVTTKQKESVTNLMDILKNHYKLKESDVYAHEKISYKTAGEGETVLASIQNQSK